MQTSENLNYKTKPPWFPHSQHHRLYQESSISRRHTVPSMRQVILPPRCGKPGRLYANLPHSPLFCLFPSTPALTAGFALQHIGHQIKIQQDPLWDIFLCRQVIVNVLQMYPLYNWYYRKQRVCETWKRSPRDFLLKGIGQPLLPPIN